MQEGINMSFVADKLVFQSEYCIKTAARMQIASNSHSQKNRAHIRHRGVPSKSVRLSEVQTTVKLIDG